MFQGQGSRRLLLASSALPVLPLLGGEVSGLRINMQVLVSQEADPEPEALLFSQRLHPHQPADTGTTSSESL